ncbi:MAG: HEPN domain-containing protein [Bryobacteraceae bacterium]
MRRACLRLTLPTRRIACSTHQQAVEKSLKAFLVWRDQSFRRTHDLVELTRQCVDLEPTLGDVMSGLGP